jgi:hypothetical protein
MSSDILPLELNGLAWIFFMSFTSSWAPNRLDQLSRMEECELHFRYIDVIGPWESERRMITAGGIKIERERGPFPTLNDTQKLFLVEKRSSLKLVSESHQDLPFYSVIAIVHDDGYDVTAFQGAPINNVFTGNFSAVIVFFFVVTASLNILFRSWDRVLKALDEELKATVCISIPKIHLC